VVDLNEVRKAHGPLKSWKFSKSPLSGNFSKDAGIGFSKIEINFVLPPP
jgi:hypothetical protein